MKLQLYNIWGVKLSRMIDEQIKQFSDNEPYSDTLFSLKGNWEKVRMQVQSEPSELKESTLEIYEATRKDFDDVFYLVDKNTLDGVEKAKECIAGVEELLKILNQKEEDNFIARQGND